MWRYEELAEALIKQINDHIWQPGDRLPSIRKSCKTYNVSPMTILQSYQLLEQQGLVYSRPKSGYFVRHRDFQQPLYNQDLTAPVSTVTNINDLLFEVLHNSKDERLTPLGAAFPDPSLFPLEQLARMLSSGTRKLTGMDAVDNMPPGNLRLRELIARRYAKHGVQVSPDELVITSGALEALNLSVQAVTSPGDIIAVEKPTFYGTLQAIERFKLKPVEIPTHPKYGIDLDALEQAISLYPIKACWLMPNFQNPLGFTMPTERKKRLVELLSQHQIPLIEDGVFNELYFQHYAEPLKKFGHQSQTLLCSSLSKCLWFGLRVGWVAAGQYAEKIQRLQSISTLSAAIPTQLAAVEYLSHARYDTHLKQLRKTLLQRQHSMLQAIRDYFPSSIRVSAPEGGYFIWIELPESINSFSLYKRLITEGIAVAPGELFSSKHNFTHHLRINSSFAWNNSLESALKRIGQEIG